MSPALRATLAVSFAVHAAIVGYALVRPASPRAPEPEIDLAEAEPVLMGDSFSALPSPTAAATAPATATATAPATAPGTAPATAPGTAPAPATPGGASAPPSGTTGSAAEVARFGAVGERGAADLTTTFARAIPQAASADAAWQTAPFGDAGTAIVVFELDEAGAMLRADVEGTPSAALRQGIDRTVALVRGRTFHAPGPIVRVRVTARISPDAVHDETNAAVFALGASYLGGAGNAFFSLSSGRRIGLDVRELAPSAPPGTR